MNASAAGTPFVPPLDFAVSGDRCATHFAPPERLNLEAVRCEANVVASAPLLREAFDAMPSIVLILNAHRQIVAANRAAEAAMGGSLERLLGLRPGEALGCIHVATAPNGCGTGRPCASCGAVRAILHCQEHQARTIGECSLLVGEASQAAALELRVTATPIDMHGERFVVVAAEDVSQSKRLAVLQRTFFHDVLNTAGCVQGYARFLLEEGAAEVDFLRRLDSLAGRLVESIQSQRDLLQAENGELELHRQPLRTRAILDELRSQYLKHEVAEGRAIRLGSEADAIVVTDRQLVLRVLGNMVKNALEATPAGGVVTIGCRCEPDTVALFVHNPGAMPEDARMQVFRRSFSTKAASGRGIGTYSMKLFGERYLQGRVDFTSSEAEGTTFTLTLPLA